MNTTDTRLAEAQRRSEALKTKRLAAQQAIEAARARLGNAFAAVADGAEVPTAAQQELAALVADEMTLAAMQLEADKAVIAARDIAFARGIAANGQHMQELLQAHHDLSHKADAAVDALAIAAENLRENGRRILDSFRELRSRNTLTQKGIVSLDLAGLVAGDQVQFLIEGGLAYRTLWWRFDRRAPFLPGALGATNALRSEFQDLMGLSSLQPAVLAAARADMAIDGVLSVPALEASEVEEPIDASDFAV